MIGGVRAVDYNGQARFLSSLAHEKSQLAVAGEAHLGEEVEVVLAQRDHTRAMALQRLAESLVAVFEGAVEQRYFVAFPAQTGGGNQGLERRIRLHLARLLPIEVEMVAVR